MSSSESDVENTNDKTKQSGMKLVQNYDGKPSPLKKPKKSPGFLKTGLEQTEIRSGIQDLLM
jgi:hypothetical protein